MVCIYCLEDKSADSFRKAEHVLSQSFGLFEKNLTLQKKVCDECNQYFGDNLEMVLARDSVEGVFRFQYDVKDSSEFKTLGKRSQLLTRIEEGPFKGAYAYEEYSKKNNRIMVKPVPQIGFLRTAPSEYEYFLLKELPDKRYLEQNAFNFNNPKGIRILACDIEIAKRALFEKGINFRVEGPIEPLQDSDEKWRCYVEREVDDTLLRAIAKIGFNYFAYWNNTGSLVHTAFSPIRRFIRYGEKADYPLAILRDESILADEPIEGMRRLGHIVTLNRAADNRSIFAQVSLFNFMTYSISIAREYPGQLRRRGHFFNIGDRKIVELTVIIK